jgi:diguanylate cyclase (GGDEF)-like protein
VKPPSQQHPQGRRIDQKSYKFITVFVHKLLTRVTATAGGHPFIVGALGTLLATGLLGVSLLTLLAARGTAIQHAHGTSRNVAAALSDNISHTLESSDQSLQTLIAALREPTIQNMEVNVRHKVLFNRAAISRYVTGIGLTDQYGNLIDGCCSSTHHWNFSDRDYFRVHRQSPKVGLYISAVYRARSRGEAVSIALTRRIDHPDGSFGGVAIVAIDVAYFGQLLENLDVGPHGVTAIIRTDGTLVARNPPLKSSHTIDFSQSSTFRRMVGQDSGFYAGRSSADGELRLYTFQRVPGTPLIAVVAPALDDVLTSWKQLSWIVGISASAIGVGFCSVVWLLAFALRDRVAAEGRLTELTQIDPLTGLRNRRALDDCLASEWARLQRNDSCLSVLYVDADHFKQYNDRHGHAEGDRALRNLAECITKHVRRRSDCAARYGGEEFVVVLPDTNAPHAKRVAEAIRAEVENALSECPPFTVSIGCASGTRASHVSLGELTNAADLALYEAKRAGRNCVVGKAISSKGMDDGT